MKSHISDIGKLLVEFKIALKKIYGGRLRDLILYGSWAREDAREDSDIDLAIVLKGRVWPGREIDALIELITDLNLKYSALISIYPVSERDYLKTESPLLLNIQKEGIRI